MSGPHGPDCDGGEGFAGETCPLCQAQWERIQRINEEHMREVEERRQRETEERKQRKQDEMNRPPTPEEIIRINLIWLRDGIQQKGVPHQQQMLSYTDSIQQAVEKILDTLDRARASTNAP